MTRARLLLAAALALLGACSLSVDPDDLAPQGAPGAPTGLSATPGNASATLTWNAVTGDVTRYEIHRGDAPETLARIGDVASSATTYVATGLTNGVVYYFAVAAVDSAGHVSGLSEQTVTMPVLPDTTAPTATVEPGDNTLDVALGTTITVAFSEAMNVGSVSVTTTPALALGAPLWSPDGTSVSFVPGGMATETEYVVHVAGSDLAGNGMVSASDFRTVGVAPTVVGRTPASGATGVPVTTTIQIQFSEPMNPASLVGNFSLSPAVSCVGGGLSWNVAQTLATCTPTANLAFSTTYTVTLTAAVADANGTPMGVGSGFSFTTAAAPHVLAPSVVSSSPAHGATGVARSSTITVTFNEAVDKQTAQDAFQVTSPAGFTGGTYSWSADGLTMIYDPPTDFPYGATVQWRVSTALRCLGGVALPAQVSWSFTVIREGTATLYSVAALDGWAANTSSAMTTSGTILYAGDTSTNTYYRAFLSFDLSAIPATATAVTQATLYVTGIPGIAGNPFADLGGYLAAQSVDYGTSLTMADFETPVLQYYGLGNCQKVCTGTLPFVLCRFECETNWWNDEYTLASAAVEGLLSVDVSGKVERDRAVRSSRGNRCQFRIKFPTNTNNDSAADYWGINAGDAAGGKPQLTVKYEYP